ncbi:MAG: GNAT family N-acetyltransferase [Actinomycetota bacterium]
MSQLPETIETPRLRLRPYTPDDVDDVFSYAADEEWSRFLPVPRPYRRGHAEEFVGRVHDPSEQVSWGVEFHGVIVGGVDLRLLTKHHRAEMGWSIARRLWGQGLGSEAVAAIIEVAFRALPDLNKIGASADARNARSIRLMEKMGMVQEARFRQQRRSRDGLTDEVWFAILRPEWESR